MYHFLLNFIPHLSSVMGHYAGSQQRFSLCEHANACLKVHPVMCCSSSWTEIVWPQLLMCWWPAIFDCRNSLCMELLSKSEWKPASAKPLTDWNEAYQMHHASFEISTVAPVTFLSTAEYAGLCKLDGMWTGSLNLVPPQVSVPGVTFRVFYMPGENIFIWPGSTRFCCLPSI